MTDETLMRRAISLARHGSLTTSPNPAVGAVIVSGGRIIGEGWHRRFGQAHAEVNAVASVADPSLLRGSTVYVTLEPCSHYGKTPPCATMLASLSVGRVVIGCVDPNPRVSGRGIAILRDAGIGVTVGVCEAECRELARKFIAAQHLGRPWITLKWAETADGFTDIDRSITDGRPARISTPLSTLAVMEIRAESDAIVVGSRTVIEDNPSLTVRGIAGRSPARVILDRRGLVPAESRVFDDNGAEVVYVATHRREDLPPHVIQTIIPAGTTLGDLAVRLRDEFGWISILIEGGPTLLRSFLDEGLWDECRIETSPRAADDAGRSPAPPRPAGTVRFTPFDGNIVATVRPYRIDKTETL
ncbi:MAG: bifunctional diaminohydroxyphosphoribosylaminopyrimidine deaminase/5-amino-6-(5-phosphoribosylamino)uracil reductase RibD [Clostridium sp.]|nr:bifunctional diaminohydroxyphosphoribosylaminopyrimidine deaminase/5-amino-6-(5-phosphoribosylamino)uracil reductase RibD [Clostridium sp.]